LHSFAGRIGTPLWAINRTGSRGFQAFWRKAGDDRKIRKKCNRQIVLLSNNITSSSLTSRQSVAEMPHRFLLPAITTPYTRRRQAWYARWSGWALELEFNPKQDLLRQMHAKYGLPRRGLSRMPSALVRLYQDAEMVVIPFLLRLVRGDDARSVPRNHRGTGHESCGKQV